MRQTQQPVSEGQRIRMGTMDNDPRPIPEGTEGTVSRVVWVMDAWHISVDWDSGRTLSIISPPDTFSILDSAKKPD